MRAITPFRPPDRVVTVDWHDRAWQPRIKTQLAGLPGAFCGLAGERMGSGTIWWGEATDEPALARPSLATTAREDARPTESCKIQHHHRTPWPASGCLLRDRRRIHFSTL